MTRTVLLTGAAGQLGQALVRSTPEGWRILPHDRNTLDVTDRERVRSVVRGIAPDAVVNAAAYTAVDRAEQEPARARAVNAEGAANVADACRIVGTRLVHVSTDFVFDGTASLPYQPHDAPSPRSVYGATKLEGERRVLELAGQTALVIRTAWLYDARGKNFLLTMLRLMRERNEVKVVSDQVGTPTAASSLARAIWASLERPDVTGIHHWTDAGVASWYDFAVAIYEEALCHELVERGVRVLPIRSVDYPLPAQRPSFSVLDKTQTWDALRMVPEHWRTTLRVVLETLARE